MSRRHKDKQTNMKSRYLVSDLHEIANLQSGAGERFLNWLLIDQAGIHDADFRSTSEMQFLTGARTVGLAVLDHVRAALIDNPGKFMRIQDMCIYNTLIEEENGE